MRPDVQARASIRNRLGFRLKPPVLTRYLSPGAQLPTWGAVVRSGVQTMQGSVVCGRGACGRFQGRQQIEGPQKREDANASCVHQEYGATRPRGRRDCAPEE